MPCNNRLDKDIDLAFSETCFLYMYQQLTPFPTQPH